MGAGDGHRGMTISRTYLYLVSAGSWRIDPSSITKAFLYQYIIYDAFSNEQSCVIHLLEGIQ